MNEDVLPCLIVHNVLWIKIHISFLIIDTLTGSFYQNVHPLIRYNQGWACLPYQNMLCQEQTNYLILCTVTYCLQIILLLMTKCILALQIKSFSF